MRADLSIRPWLLHDPVHDFRAVADFIRSKSIGPVAERRPRATRVDINPRISVGHEHPSFPVDRSEVGHAQRPANVIRAKIARLAKDRRDSLAILEVGRETQIDGDFHPVVHSHISRREGDIFIGRRVLAKY